jgi:hypothetical protein
MTNNFVYKVIDIPELDAIHNEVRSYALSQIPNYTEAFNLVNLPEMMNACPKTFEWMLNAGLMPRVCALIIQPPGADLRGTHTDTQVNDLALNFSIKNTKNTYTGFYKVVSGEVIRKTLPNGVEWDNFEQAELEEIARIDLEKPTIINTKVPHAVHNPTLNPRISISFRFVKDPYHLVSA